MSKAIGRPLVLSVSVGRDKIETNGCAQMQLVVSGPFQGLHLARSLSRLRSRYASFANERRRKSRSFGWLNREWAYAGDRQIDSHTGVDFGLASRPCTYAGRGNFLSSTLSLTQQVTILQKGIGRGSIWRAGGKKSLNSRLSGRLEKGRNGSLAH